MSPLAIAALVGGYFVLLLVISYFTSRNATTTTFFTANRQSPWYVVAFGMVGATLSGVTFISVPGWVGTSQFSYMQMVLGYLVGYFVIGAVLMPLYYRLNLTSIYTYLDKRFGFWSYKTGAFFFLLSRVIGASFRLYLVANVLQITIFEPLNIAVPFWVTVVITILLIWLYTFKGGIKTIIWTDTLQTLFMLTAVGASIYVIAQSMQLAPSDVVEVVRNSDFSRTFFFDNGNSPNYFFKQFFAGAFIAIVMTGLDQDMMQKNLTCRNIKDAQKNMFWFSIVLVFVKLLFLSLGVLLYEYSLSHEILAFDPSPENGNILLIKDAVTGEMLPRKTDDLFPLLATQGYFMPLIGIFFVLGLIASAYSSADSALTALTTSFSVDFLDIEKKEQQQRDRIRKIVHVAFSLLLIGTILIFWLINDESVISAIFRIAGYTYGPLLGLYAFGLFTRLGVRDRAVPVIALLSPIISYVLNLYSTQLFNGYEFGFELLIMNGAITFTGLLLFSTKKNEKKVV